MLALTPLWMSFSIALKEKGAEVVQATFDDVESLKKAFKGAHGVFVVTNCEFPFSITSHHIITNN